MPQAARVRVIGSAGSTGQARSGTAPVALARLAFGPGPGGMLIPAGETAPP